MNGNTPSGPGHRPGLPGGGPGAGLVPRLRGAAPAPAPAGRPGGHGARPGAGGACGLLGGVFSTLAGASPSKWLCWPWRGDFGILFHKAASFWGKWLACLGILTGMEVLLALGHGLAGASLLAALGLAGRELLLSAACFPLAFLLTRQGGRMRRRGAGAGAAAASVGRAVSAGTAGGPVWTGAGWHLRRGFPPGPGGAPISCEEMGRKKPRGDTPGPPFLWPARFHSLVLAVVPHCSGGRAISLPIYVP